MQFNRFWLVILGFAATLLALEATGIGMDTVTTAPGAPTTLAPNTLATAMVSDAVAERSTVLARIDRSPLYFEQNIGQFAEEILFTSATPNYHLALSPTSATLTLNRSGNSEQVEKTAQIGLRVLNSQIADVVGLRRLNGTSSYYTSGNRRDWITGAPHYRGVKYKHVYPGVDLEYYGNRDELEYDFIVQPEADPNQIRVGYDGLDAISLDDNGNALLHFGADTLIQQAPYAYQELNGQSKAVEVRYLLLDDGTRSGKPVLGFKLGDYDTRADLIIDPILSYSALLGGDLFDAGGDITVDRFGNAYTVNRTFTPNPGAADPANVVCGYNCQSNILVRKFSADTNELLWSAMLSGESDDDGRGIAVDDEGFVYVAGWTSSEHFPVTDYRAVAFAGISDGFIAKLDPSGTDLAASIFVGTSQAEILTDLTLDKAGNVYIAGRSSVPDYDSTENGEKLTAVETDGFVAKYSPDLQRRHYARFFRGKQFDTVDAIAVDNEGRLFVAGSTDSQDFGPAKDAGLALSGISDAFLLGLDKAGKNIEFVRLIGGNGTESARSLSLDRYGQPVVTGITTSADLPLKGAAFRRENSARSDWDGFIAKFSADGEALLFSTYLGGAEHDYATDVAIADDNSIYVAGYTYSADFPMHKPLFGERNGPSDIFVSHFSEDGQSLLSSTYFGGSAEESFAGIAVDSAGSTYLTGLTFSADFPVNGAFGASIASSRTISGDGFIAKMTNLLDYTISNNTWQVLSMPYSPPNGATVEDIFADDIPGRYKKHWYLYRYEAASGNYSLMELDDQPVQGEAYWILQNTGKQVTVDMPEGSYSRTRQDDPVCPPHRTCFRQPLQADPYKPLYHFVGNPFPAPISWQSIRVSAEGTLCSAQSGGCNLREAREAGLVNAHGWAFLHGKNRRLEEGGILQPWQGFWLQALPGAAEAAPEISIVR